jgi:tetratricopeptide (TPR) repeat protein
VATPRDEKPSAPKLEIKLLGRFEVLRDGEPILEEAWGRRKTKDVLKLLLTEPDIQRGANSRFVRHVGEGHALTLGPLVWIDTIAPADQLATALALADTGDWTPAIRAFEDALTLYRGDFLAEDRYAEWAESPRRRLREQYLEALGQLAECFAALGRLRQAISCCQRVLGIEPHRESVIRRLMEYQDTAGHRAQALGTYGEGTRALKERLGVEPSAETRALYEQIRDRVTSAGDLDPRRVEYNETRPHSSLGNRAPAAYVAELLGVGSSSRVQEARFLTL